MAKWFKNAGMKKNYHKDTKTQSSTKLNKKLNELLDKILKYYLLKLCEPLRLCALVANKQIKSKKNEKYN